MNSVLEDSIVYNKIQDRIELIIEYVYEPDINLKPLLPIKTITHLNTNDSLMTVTYISERDFIENYLIIGKL